MGLWDDIKMGIGAAPKTQDFVDRTARTIERNQGSNAASTYSNQMTNKVNENTGQNFDNNYTASEGSQTVVNQFNDNDDDNSAGGVRNISEGNIFSALGETLNEENRSTMFGGQLKDYSNLNNDRFQANDLTQDGNMVGYSKYGNSSGSQILITDTGKFRVISTESAAENVGVSPVADYDTLDEAFLALDILNSEPANTFARYNAATQDGLRDKDATVYANDTSLNNPADALEEFGPVYEPQPTDPTDLEQNTMVDPDPVDEDTTDYTPYQYVKDGETYQVGDEEIKEITLYKQLGYNDQEINNFLNQRFSFRTPTVVEEIDQGSMMDNMAGKDEDLYEDDTETVVPETVVQPVVQGTNAVYKPLPQTDSSTYTPTPYDPSAPTYTTPAQVTTTPTQFNPQYVAGPVQQTLTLPTTTMQAGQTQTVMYRNQRGQQIPVTEVDGKPMTYVPPGYTRMSTPQPFNQGGAVGYAEGGDTSLDAEYNLATKFLGYKGPKSRSALNDFMKASPGAAARMGKYQQAMMGMYKGGVVYANDGTDVGLTDGGEADASISGAGDEYYDTTLPMFFDAVSQTMQPMQSTYSTIAPDSNQFISGDAGQVSTYAPTVDAAQVSTTSQATTPTYTPAATYGATGTADQVRSETAATPTISGEVRDKALVTGAQGTSSVNIDAAQGTATMMTNPVTREIQSGELISGAADAQKAAKFTEQIQAAQATPSKQATVQGQLEGLMQQFESGDTPAWAAGAMRNAMGAMAARGLGASSLAGQAVVQAAMESALPIASADAQTIASFEAQNLSNRQQRAMLAAQQRAQFMGQEFDQAFQARVQNSSRIADIANMNFTAEQQVALENSRAANTMNLANLSNRQAGVMAEAAAIANMDMANLNNRQQAAVQNAQNFMAMDMSNLDRAQQTALFRSQQNIQALFTDQAAENAALQFNASSENQTKQFFASLSSQTSQFNAAQTNAVNQFNVNSVNAINEFNANLQQQRDTFNATNGLVVSQANAQWRQNLATLNTAAANDSNMAFALAMNNMTSKNIDSIWQRERDLMSYNITSVESGKDRATQILLGNQTLEALREKIGYAEDSAESEFFMRFLFGDFGDLFGSKD